MPEGDGLIWDGKFTIGISPKNDGMLGKFFFEGFLVEGGSQDDTRDDGTGLVPKERPQVFKEGVANPADKNIGQ